MIILQLLLSIRNWFNNLSWRRQFAQDGIDDRIAELKADKAKGGIEGEFEGLIEEDRGFGRRPE